MAEDGPDLGYRAVFGGAADLLRGAAPALGALAAAGALGALVVDLALYAATGTTVDAIEAPGWAVWASVLLGLLVTTPPFAASFLVCRARAAGATLGAADALAATVLRLGGVLLVSVLATLAVMLGVLALIVPGLYLAGMLFAALPIATIEGGGLGALGASTALTRGARWRMVGLLVLPLAPLILGFVALGALAGGGVAARILTLPLEIAFSAYYAALIYEAYRRLRAARPAES